jgi:PIN domain nuclease of toxin-antitoxin system
LPALRQLDLKIVSPMSYDETEARARLHAGTRVQGLSLGDCVCLATAAARGWIAVTEEKTRDGILSTLRIEGGSVAR